MIDKWYRSIGLIVPVAMAAMLVVTQVDNTAAKLIAGFLLVFILPGAGFATVMFPPSRTGWLEWIIGAVALSLGLNILGGLVLHLSPFGLHRTSWAILLGSVSLVTGIGRQIDPAWRPSIRLSIPSIVQGALLLSAVLVAAGALMLSIQGLTDLPRAGYTVLWAQPSDSSDGAGVLRLGMSNAEGSEVSYRLSAQQDGASIGEWSSIRLGVDETWTGAVQLPSTISKTTPIVATLYREESDTVYRQLLIWPNELAQ